MLVLLLLLEKLLKDNRVNPADKNSKALHLACRYGHEQTVRLLLIDGKSNISAKNNRAMEAASINADMIVLDSINMLTCGGKLMEKARVSMKNRYENIVRILKTYSK